jgi:hypothetical protein
LAPPLQNGVEKLIIKWDLTVSFLRHELDLVGTGICTVTDFGLAGVEALSKDCFLISLKNELWFREFCVFGQLRDYFFIFYAADLHFLELHDLAESAVEI